MNDLYDESMAALSIKRYEQGEIVSLEDCLGREASLTVKFPEGNHRTLSCTPTHLKELEAGILYSHTAMFPSKENDFPEETPDYARILKEQKEFSIRSRLFLQTGSVHSGQLMSMDYVPVFFTEDMSRHNVLDKLIGYASLNNLDLTRVWLMISSRMPLELMLKAHLAGIQRICCISAPTLEAVNFARERKIILLGMFRGDRFNIYSPSEKE